MSMTLLCNNRTAANHTQLILSNLSTHASLLTLLSVVKDYTINLATTAYTS